jgi:hypothetical protein
MLTDSFVAGGSDGFTDRANATPSADAEGASAYASTRMPRSKNERDAYAAVYRKSPASLPSFDRRWSGSMAGPQPAPSKANSPASANPTPQGRDAFFLVAGLTPSPSRRTPGPKTTGDCRRFPG